MSNKLIESLKEAARVIILALVSYLLAGGVEAILTKFGTNMDTGTKLIVSGALTTVLRSLDKYLHETGKETEDETGKKSLMTGGLTRF